MTKSSRLYQSIVKSPILWGAGASICFYWLIRGGVLSHRLVEQYCTRHPVEYITTTMFFVGLAALAIKALDIFSQYSAMNAPLLGPVPGGGQAATECDALLKRLDQVPPRQENLYLVQRLRNALEHVRRQGSAETLDDELKYLAEADAGRVHSSYALVRVIIWAIPMLGFLGTVIGLTLAIAKLAPSALEESSMEVIGGLAVAFDTTALALALSLVLMFAQFLTDKKEFALLDEVDRRATAELGGRFEQIADTPDGQLVAVRRMAETVVRAAGNLVEQQTELWQASMDAAAARWAKMADDAGERLQRSLAGALSESLKAHAHELAVAEHSAARQTLQHWENVQQAQSGQFEAMASLQAAVSDQGKVLGRVIEATGEIVKLEDVLNRNLAGLAGAKNFEQTVMSLAAVIHLLNARLTDTAEGASQVKLQTNQRTGHAA